MLTAVCQKVRGAFRHLLKVLLNIVMRILSSVALHFLSPEEAQKKSKIKMFRPCFSSNDI
jgi:hypothetical protein